MTDLPDDIPTEKAALWKYIQRLWAGEDSPPEGYTIEDIEAVYYREYDGLESAEVLSPDEIPEDADVVQLDDEANQTWLDDPEA